MNSNGTVGAQLNEYKWPKGFIQAKPFKIKNKTFLFLLNKNGTATISKIHSDGNIEESFKTYNLSKGWTSAEFLYYNGETKLMLLKRGDGKVHVHIMNSDGTVGSRSQTFNWSEDWSHVRSYYAGSENSIFLSKESNGSVKIHWVYLNNIGSKTKSYFWLAGWSSVEFYRSGKDTYLFLLKKDNGIVHVHRMHRVSMAQIASLLLPPVGELVDAHDWTSGWTQAKPFNVGNKLFLFLLKGKTGEVHIHKIR